MSRYRNIAVLETGQQRMAAIDIQSKLLQRFPCSFEESKQTGSVSKD